MTIGTETMEMGPGDFMMIPRGVRHRVQRLGDAKAYFATGDTPPVDPKKIVWLEQAPKKQIRPAHGTGHEKLNRAAGRDTVRTSLSAALYLARCWTGRR